MPITRCFTLTTTPRKCYNKKEKKENNIVVEYR